MNNNITNVSQISKSAIQCRKRDKYTSSESENDSSELQKSILLHDLDSDSPENTEQVSSVDESANKTNTNSNSETPTESTLVAEMLFDLKTGSMISTDTDNNNVSFNLI